MPEKGGSKRWANAEWALSLRAERRDLEKSGEKSGLRTLEEEGAVTYDRTGLKRRGHNKTERLRGEGRWLRIPF